MANIERMTISMPADMVAIIKRAVEGGDYASTSEVVREALRDWKAKQALRSQALGALRADVDEGLADVVAGRIAEFDADRIIARGRTLSAARSSSG